MRKRFVLILTIISYTFILQAQTDFTDKQDEFYKPLVNQIDAGRFSPLIFSGGANQIQPSHIKFNKNKKSIECIVDNDTFDINYSPISILKNGIKNGSEYAFKVQFIDGTVKVIRKLKSPTVKNNTLLFLTETDGLKIEITPCTGSFKWSLSTDNDKIKSISVIVQAEGPFFGGGERFIGSNLTGRTISNQPNDRIWLVEDKKVDIYSYEPSYMPVPFVLSSTGQGWYFDQSYSVFMTFASDSKSFEIRGTKNQPVFYTFIEKTPKEVLNKFTMLIGRQPPLPDWALGVWINLLEGKDSVYSKANKLKEWGIPATALWLFDMDDPQTSTGWSYWTKGFYGNYREVTDSLHNLGYKVLTYLHPFSYDYLVYYTFKNPVYKKLDSLKLILKMAVELDPNEFKYFVTTGQYDFFNPAMYKVWYEMLHELLIDDNFDGWMEDFGDIGYTYNVESREWKPLPFTNSAYNTGYKISTNEYFNLYPLVYHKLTYELSSEFKKDFVSFCRSGSAGSAPFTRMVWGGDQSPDWNKKFGYPSAISAALSSGLSGYGNWAPDILCDSPSGELWMRWVQFGAFTPLMRDHLWSYKKSSVNLWKDTFTREYFKKYALIHAKLLPYLRKTADIYQHTGCPMIRHMFLEFPDDKETQKCEFQYMLGDKYLVAPVVEEGAVTNSIYFPKGKWQNFWTKKILNSTGTWKTVEAPMDIIPVYEKLSE
jgi:alpha-glucosidase